MAAVESTRRSHGLDGIRAVFMLIVFVTHARRTALPGGVIAVDVFFALSGYVITGLLLREYDARGQIALRRFYFNRLARLWPAMLLVSLFALAVSLIAPNATGESERTAPLFAATWTMDFARAAAPPMGDVSRLLGHTWSLAVEEHFYLVWPLVLVLLLRIGGRRAAMGGTFGVVLACPILRGVFWHGTASVNRFYNAPDTRADQLLMGCLLALLLWKAEARLVDRIARVAHVTVWPALLLLAGLLFVPLADSRLGTAFYLTVGLSITAVIGTILVAVCVLEPEHLVTRVLAFRPLAEAGRKYSYSFYLWHLPLLTLLGSHPVIPHLQIPLAFASAAIMAFASRHLVEDPARKSLTRWRDARAAPSQPDAAPTTRVLAGVGRSGAGRDVG